MTKIKPISSMATPRFADIATFFRLPVIKDLSKLDYCICGVPWDGGTTNRPGARHGPREVRNASSLIRLYHPISLKSPYEKYNIADIGDCPVNPADLKDSLKRSQADLINYRKRTDEERQTLIKYGNERLLVKILPILDEFNMALNHTQSDETQSAWSDGIRLIHRKLQSIIESEGVTSIDAKEKSFDPLEHEAIAQQESDVHEENQVINIIREGIIVAETIYFPNKGPLIAIVLLATSLSSRYAGRNDTVRDFSSVKNTWGEEIVNKLPDQELTLKKVRKNNSSPG